MTKNEQMAKLVGVTEATALTGFDRRTIHRKALRGELTPVVKLPGLRGAYLFKREDVLALIPAPAEPDSPQSDSAGASSAA